MKRAIASLLLVVAVMPWACSSNEEPGSPGGGDAGDAAHGGADTGRDTSIGPNDAAGSGDDVGSDTNDGAAPIADATTDVHDVGADALLSCAPASATPVAVSGDITSDRSLTCDKVYTFSGLVNVQAPATLTIQQGTTILMQTGASIVVLPGAKIMAIGTREQPVVFTSAKPEISRGPGDWGSICLLGKAPGNWGKKANGTEALTKHAPDGNPWPTESPLPEGGSDPVTLASYTDSSGALVYVRMEYGGSVMIGDSSAADHEILGLYGVGNGTVLDYIDMRQANYGCLFAEGGTFDAKHLICQYGGNTAFGLSRGGKNRLQFVIDQESPKKAAEGLGIKGPRDNNQLSPFTDPTVYNVTVCGTNGSLLTAKDPYGLFLRREPAGHVFNFIASGFSAGVSMLGNTGFQASTELRSSILFGNFDPTLDGGTSTNIAYEAPPNQIDLVTWFNNPTWKNSATTDPGLTCFDANTFGFAPATPLSTNAAVPPDDGFFDKTATYIGALKDKNDTWATGAWVVWKDK